MRILVKRILADAGHECVLVEDGAQALAALSEKPDVVVLDAMMPVIDGYEACRRLRERDSRIPVMILTARSDIIDKRIGFRSGADDYVVKPFDPNELLLRLEALYRRGTLSDAPGPERLVYRDLEVLFENREVRLRGRAGGTHSQGIRPFAASGKAARKGVLERTDSGQRVGGRLRRRVHEPCRSGAPFAREDRTIVFGAGIHPDGLGHRLPLRRLGAGASPPGVRRVRERRQASVGKRTSKARRRPCAACGNVVPTGGAETRAGERRGNAVPTGGAETRCLEDAWGMDVGGWGACRMPSPYLSPFFLDSS